MREKASDAVYKCANSPKFIFLNFISPVVPFEGQTARIEQVGVSWTLSNASYDVHVMELMVDALSGDCIVYVGGMRRRIFVAIYIGPNRFYINRTL